MALKTDRPGPPARRGAVHTSRLRLLAYWRRHSACLRLAWSVCEPTRASRHVPREPELVSMVFCSRHSSDADRPQTGHKVRPPPDQWIAARSTSSRDCGNRLSQRRL